MALRSPCSKRADSWMEERGRPELGCRDSLHCFKYVFDSTRSKEIRGRQRTPTHLAQRHFWVITKTCKTFPRTLVRDCTWLMGTSYHGPNSQNLPNSLEDLDPISLTPFRCKIPKRIIAKELRKRFTPKLYNQYRLIKRRRTTRGDPSHHRQNWYLNSLN